MTYVSRSSRIAQYAKMAGPRGESTQKNIDYWSGRASANSELASRATDGAMKLPSTKMSMRDTGMAPKQSRSADARMVAKSDTNDSESSPYMRGIRRQG